MARVSRGKKRSSFVTWITTQEFSSFSPPSPLSSSLVSAAAAAEYKVYDGVFGKGGGLTFFEFGNVRSADAYLSFAI